MQFNQILEIMHIKGISQKQLADYLSVSVQKVCDWKGGRLQSWKKQLPEITEFLGVSMDDLLGREKKFASSDVISKDEADLIRCFRVASPEIQEAVMRVLTCNKTNIC